MSKAYVLNHQLNAADRSKIDAAVQAAGYEPVHRIPKDFSELDPEGDIGVVGLPSAPEEEALINARMQAFAGAGIRVVCIWLYSEEGDGTGVPEGVGKYGTTVDIGSPELTGTLKGEFDVWQDPGGAASSAPKTTRNKC